MVALGSDWPIAPFDARWVIADAQLRRRWDGQDDTDRSLPDAGAHPADGAGGLHHPRRRGRRAGRPVGHDQRGQAGRPDRVHLDPLAAPPDEFAVAPIALTVVDGAIATATQPPAEAA